MLDRSDWSLRLLCLFLYPGITGVQYHTWLVVNALTSGSWLVVNVRSFICLWTEILSKHSC